MTLPEKRRMQMRPLTEQVEDITIKEEDADEDINRKEEDADEDIVQKRGGCR